MYIYCEVGEWYRHGEIKDSFHFDMFKIYTDASFVFLITNVFFPIKLRCATVSLHGEEQEVLQVQSFTFGWYISIEKQYICLIKLNIDAYHVTYT